MNVAEILTELGRTAPWDKGAEWDPIGLQLGDPLTETQTVAVCHEVTEAVVRNVEDGRVDLLVTYHPLLFSPTTKLVAGRSPVGRAYRLIRAGVALAVIHTNFDVAPGGTADALAAALQLTGTTGFGPVDGQDSVKVVTFVPEGAADVVANAMAEAGGGTIGNYSNCSFRTGGVGTFFAGEGASPVSGTKSALNREPEIRIEMSVPVRRRDAVVGALVVAHPYEEPAFDVYSVSGNLGLVGRVGSPGAGITTEAMAVKVRGTLAGNGVRVSGDPARLLERVAVVPGSGAAYIGAAASVGADLLVTGDVSHHRMIEAADRGMAVIDAGHVATELPGMQNLYDLVAGIVPGTIDLTNLAVGEAGL
jgi:dinuclear metal center YbgI/SA1388 family protein